MGKVVWKIREVLVRFPDGTLKPADQLTKEERQRIADAAMKAAGFERCEKRGAAWTDTNRTDIAVT